jgi:hypothetical protein
MGNTVWNTPDEGTAIIAGQIQLIRALAAELHRLGKLDDDLLARIEKEATTKTKNTIFNPEANGALQIHLMDFSIGAIREGLKFLRAGRDSGGL